MKYLKYLDLYGTPFLPSGQSGDAVSGREAFNPGAIQAFSLQTM